MSISRNFFLGRELIHRIGPTYLLDKDAMNERTVAALADIGIEIRRPAEEVLRLSGGERQSIAIGRAAHFGQKLLILDEPTSALSVGETRKVLNYTLEAKRAGLSVIFITHNIGHVYQVADRFTIISHGHKVGDFMKGEVNQEEISSMIMGGEVPDRLKPVIEEREAELRKTRDSIAAATVSIVHAQQVRSRRNTILLSAAALAIIIFFAALLVGSGAFGSIEPTAVPTVVPTIDIATVPQDVLDQIALLQTSQNPDERALAATRLGAKKNLAAFDALVAALQDDAWQVRQAAIKALGKLADPRAIDPIEALMRDNYSEVRNAALAVLKDTYGLDCSDANGCPR
jgi:energy-coupling factor transporter ATP-binding protein EcfA2